jgi:hypothetical protein
MRRWKRAIVLGCAVTVLTGGALAVPSAWAAAGNPIINDCEASGQLTHAYTLSQLRHALAVMPASVKQYTNCYDVIQQALIQARKTGSAGPAASGGSGGSFLPTPVLIILIVLVLAALGLGGLALVRRRRRPSDGRSPHGGSPE